MWLKIYKSKKMILFVLDSVWWYEKWKERQNNYRHNIIVTVKGLLNSIECIVDDVFAL